MVEVAVPLQGVQLHPPLRGWRRGILHICGGLAEQVVGVQQGHCDAWLVLPPALAAVSRVRGGDCLQAPAADPVHDATDAIQKRVSRSFRSAVDTCTSRSSQSTLVLTTFVLSQDP